VLLHPGPLDGAAGAVAVLAAAVATPGAATCTDEDVEVDDDRGFAEPPRGPTDSQKSSCADGAFAARVFSAGWS